MGSFLALLFPIFWVVFVGKKEALMENVLLGLGGCISSLFFYLLELWDKHKIKKTILKRINERRNGDMVLISHQERIHFGTTMKNFVKQPGRIQTSSNNIEGLSKYKITEKIKRKLEKC